MERRLKFLFLVSAAAVVFWLPAPVAVRHWPSFAAPASASIVLGSGETYQETSVLGETAVTRFLRAHTALVLTLVPIIMGFIYVMIFGGPGEVLDAWRHLPPRRGGFMSPPGGFGGISSNFKDPWN